MWQKKDNSLYRKFIFKNFDEAFDFIEKIAIIAKEKDHHPEFKSKYNEVEIWLTTHSAGKVTERDREFAHKIDSLITNSSETKAGELTKAKLFTDGGSRGNPGPSATGVVILDMEDNVVKKSGKYIGESTNNQAEYQALKEGLELARSLGVRELLVYMDSELIIKQINGTYRVKNVDLIPIYDRIKNLKKDFRKLSFSHVPREKNKLADKMVNDALDSHSG